MAGGVGSRFWPMSTPAHPKQFIDILGTGRTLLQSTVDRFSGLCAMENVWVITSAAYREMVREQLPEIPEDNVLLEPCMRNTAPAIAYACWKIKKKNPGANLVISPSDHIVLNTEEFKRVIRKGLEFTASEDRILTLGMRPTRPETGYGYIKSCREGDSEILEVEAFREKPDKQTAEMYLQAGGYTWNSGIFLWNTDTIEKAFRRNEPELAQLFDRMSEDFYTSAEQERVDRDFPTAKKISIDYAVMEHARNIYVFPADFGWSDLGTWGSLYELSQKDADRNAVIGEHVGLVECEDCIIHVSADKKVVLQGLQGYIVAERNNVFLVCKKEDEQRIKSFSDTIGQ